LSGCAHTRTPHTYTYAYVHMHGRGLTRTLHITHAQVHVVAAHIHACRKHALYVGAHALWYPDTHATRINTFMCAFAWVRTYTHTLVRMHVRAHTGNPHA